MTQKRVQKAGGKKETETPFAVVNSSGLEREPLQQHYTLSPGDAEFDYYSELFKGFLRTLTRWREILTAGEYRRLKQLPISHILFPNRTYYDIDVVQTPQSLEISPPDDTVTPNRVLRMTGEASFNDSEAEVRAIKFLIRPGPAGQHFFTDPVDRMPLEEIEIDAGDTFLAQKKLNSIEIITKRHIDKPEKDINFRRAEYTNPLRNILTVTHGGNYYPAMNNEMAVSLINTIDALIPGTLTPTPQPGRRATAERATPRLPAPRRGTPRG